jgi:hypothetical protein
MNTPQPPDPYETAAAQTKSNKETAGYQQSLNMIDQNTPYGSVNYNQTGIDPVTGAPRYAANTTLSPEMKALADKGISNSQGNANLEGSLLGNVQNTLSKPLDLSWGATEQHLNDLNRHTLDPEWDQRQQQFEQMAANKGYQPGSEGYDSSYRDFGNSRSQAYNNMYLQGHNTAVNDATQQYNSPLNALSALRSNSQVSQPGVGQTAATPSTGVQGTNIAGLIQDNYKSQLANSQATMGGLFGLGGSLISGLGMFSDRRLKKNIEYIGHSENQLPIYSFEYVWGGGKKVGHMADEVEVLYPWAVQDVNGFKSVDYGVI